MQPLIRSAWDLHVFDVDQRRTFSAGFYAVPKAKLSFTIQPRTVDNEADLVIRADTHAGGRGVVLKPGGTFSLGAVLLRVCSGSPFDALERSASMIAERNNVRPPQILPIGWVDWYFAKARTTEKDVLDNLDFMARELKDFGLEYVQLDSGWQLGVETTPPPHNVIAGGPWVPNSKFPRGMKWYADRIRERGLKPGIWVRPFHIIDGGTERKEHPDWFNKKGQMDFSHSGVLEYVRNLFKKLTDEWGYEYIKFDFPSYDLFAEWGPKLFEDHAAHTEPHDQTLTNVQAYRRAMEVISEAVGGKAELLACNSVMAPTLGMAGVFRIGDDVGDWNRTFQYGVKSVSARYYTNGIYWTNDPDVLLVREPFTVEQARMWASLIALSGGVVFISEDFSQLPHARVEILKKVMPVYRNKGYGYQFGRPIDLLENNPPQIWNLKVERDFESWNVIGLFNWSDKELEREIQLDAFGLSSDNEYHVFEFWMQDYLGHVCDRFKVSLQPWSCKVVSLRKVSPHPQVLSTSRHVTQGGVELRGVKWESDKLSGMAHLVKQNPYDIVVHVPAAYRVIRIEGGQSIPAPQKEILVLRLVSPETKEIPWSIKFSPLR